jgi:cell volume regulation protein A
MDISYQIILIGALLLLVSVLATSFSSRVGMPILLVFLMIGILAGEQGPGKILFQNVQNAHLGGVFALAAILLDAGLNTKISSFQIGLLPALFLSSVGVLITSIVVGLFAMWILHVSWLEGLLVGAILGPTDAAAVFSVLRATHIKLQPNVAATLEIESGSNDPIGVLLTISIIHLLLAGHAALTIKVFIMFLTEIGLGTIIGVAAGYLIIWFGNRIKLVESLYPLFVLSSAMLIFAATNLLGGSGYLALYLAGIIIGNSQIHHHGNVLRLHDSLAWLSQISMFLMLGLLVKPSALFPYMLPGLFIALALIMLARPTAVWISLLPFRFNWREKTFIAWTGLKGAVPIILAINPLLVGLKYADLYFNLTFFTVVISIILQGWPLPILARWLKVTADKEF